MEEVANILSIENVSCLFLLLTNSSFFILSVYLVCNLQGFGLMSGFSRNWFTVKLCGGVVRLSGVLGDVGGMSEVLV